MVSISTFLLYLNKIKVINRVNEMSESIKIILLDISLDLIFYF